MNRVLFKAAAIVNIAAAALIYVACSGDDGKDGPPGQAGSSCEGTPSTATPGAIDIKCGGALVGTLQPGTPGQNGQGVPASGCYLQQSATGYDAICGGQNMGPLAGGTGGGCAITDGDKYWIFNCGGAPTQIGKAWCGDVAYNPSKQVCDLSTGEVSDAKCGITTINLDYEFCVSGKKYFLCGTRSTLLNNSTGTYDTIVTKGIAYDPATQFCYSNIYFNKGTTVLPTGSAADTVYARCGTVEVPVASGSLLTPANTDSTHSNHNPRGIGWFDAKRQFCFASTTGSEVTTLCGNKISPDLYGDKFAQGQVCMSGVVKATCGNNPPVDYEASEKFCQGAGANATVKFLCGPDGLTYTADQFCQVASGDGEAQSYTDASAPTAKVETRCVKSATVKDPFLPTEFCQQQPGANAYSLVKPLCGSTAETAEKYTSTQFCQSGISTPPIGTTEITSGGIGANSVIKDKCGAGATARVFPSASYCPTGGSSPVNSPYCTNDGRSLTKVNNNNKPFDPEIEFCATGMIFPTCAARTGDLGPTAALPYKPSEVVCDPKSNTKLDVVTFKEGIPPVGVTQSSNGGINYSSSSSAASKSWLAKNLTISGASTFTWNEAKAACEQLGTIWSLPSDFDWEGLARASDPTVGFEGANAGINIRTLTGWGQYPSLDPVYSKFAATPAAVTGITPAPAANSAYWWTAGQGGWITVTNPTTGVTTVVAGTNYDLGNTRYTTELNPTLIQGGASKLSTKLSVRCASPDVSTYLANTPSADYDACLAEGGVWQIAIGSDTAAATDCTCPDSKAWTIASKTCE